LGLGKLSIKRKSVLPNHASETTIDSYQTSPSPFSFDLLTEFSQKSYTGFHTPPPYASSTYLSSISRISYHMMFSLSRYPSLHLFALLVHFSEITTFEAIRLSDPPLFSSA